jgi:uncharacterized damage-inducible protein DinB
MLGKDDFARLFDYTVWANHRLMRGAATLASEDFRRDLGASHGGVRGTLVHIMAAEWIWLERWKGVSPRRLFDEGEFPDLLAVRDRWAAIEEHRAAWLEALRPEAAAEPVRYHTTEGREFQAPLWHLVQHLANHSTYHRGQVSLLMRRVGGPTVSTDLLVYDRDQERRQQA